MKETYRSRIFQWFDTETIEGICEVPYQIGLSPTGRKDRLMSLLNNNHKTKFQYIGTGTNRHIVRVGDYVAKISVDREGIADNRMEYAMSPRLRGTSPTFEILKGGNILIAEYDKACVDYKEFQSYFDEARDMLDEWATFCILGDVGLTEKNYANYGVSPAGELRCIDYAYVIPADISKFKCRCGRRDSLILNDDYTGYKCKCGIVYSDRELRTRITNSERERYFNLADGIMLHSEKEEHEIPPEFERSENRYDSPFVNNDWLFG